MPSLRHDTMVDLFRHTPALARELLISAVPLPPWSRVELRSASVVELKPAERHADLMLEPNAGPLVVLEVQGRIDAEKR